MRSIEATGKSVDAAIFAGLQQLGISIDEVSIEIIQLESRGVLGIGAKPAKVRLTEKPAEEIIVPDFEAERERSSRERRDSHDGGHESRFSRRGSRASEGSAEAQGSASASGSGKSYAGRRRPEKKRYHNIDEMLAAQGGGDISDADSYPVNDSIGEGTMLNGASPILNYAPAPQRFTDSAADPAPSFDSREETSAIEDERGSSSADMTRSIGQRGQFEEDENYSQRRNDYNRGRGNNRGRNGGYRGNNGKYANSDRYANNGRYTNNGNYTGRTPKNSSFPSETGQTRTMMRPESSINYTEEAAANEPAAEFVAELIRLMGIDGKVLAARDEDAIRLRIDSNTMGVLIGHRGETLDAIQYLTSLVINRNRREEGYTRVTINTEDYREKREETLIKLAKRVAQQVRNTGRPRALEPMNPYERRILHSALQNNPYVMTHSEGDEPNRRVVVTPRRRPYGSRRPDNGRRYEGRPAPNVPETPAAPEARETTASVADGSISE